MRLFEISAIYEELLAKAIDPATGELIEPELERQLDSVAESLNDKALAIATYIVELDTESERVLARAKVMADRGKRLRDHVESLKRYLGGHLAVGSKLKNDEVTLAIVAGAYHVEITGRDQIPTQYRRQPEWTEAKREILEALKAGQTVAGAELRRGEPSVRVK